MGFRQSKLLILAIWLLLLGNLFLMFSFRSWPRIISGFFVLVYIIIFSAVSQKSWANKFWENVGIAIFAGLVVSLFRDFTEKNFDPFIFAYYFVGFGVSVVLILIGLLGVEKQN